MNDHKPIAHTLLNQAYVINLTCGKVESTRKAIDGGNHNVHVRYSAARQCYVAVICHAQYEMSLRGNEVISIKG